MLISIPQEITEKILSYLNKRDLSQCLLVCSAISRLAQRAFYSTIVLRDAASMNTCVDFFMDHKTMTHWVQTVNMQVESDLNSSALQQSITDIFPKLASLVIYIQPSSLQLNVNPNCQTTLKHIRIFGDGTSCILPLLQSAQYQALTSLRLGFRVPRQLTGLDSDTYIIDLGKKLLSCFENTPSLKELVLDGTGFGLSDMQQLHSHLPALEHLKFTCVDTRQSSASTPNTQPTSLKSIDITINTSSQATFIHRETMGDIVLKWLNYVRSAYPGLEDFGFGFSEESASRDRLHNFDAIQQLMLQTISQLKKLHWIDSSLLSYTRENTAFWEENPLQSVELWDIYISIKSQLETLENSKLSNNIKTLNLTLTKDDAYRDPGVFKAMFLDCKLQNLSKMFVDIKLDNDLYLDYALPIYLLQNLPNLEVLSVNFIEMDDEEEIPHVGQTRLKSFSIGFFNGCHNLQTASKFFETIFKASPLLEKFSMLFSITYARDKSCLILNLKDHNKHLQTVRLYHGTSDAILLLNDDPQQPRKYWKSMTEEISKPSEEEGYKLMDVRWNTQTSLSIQYGGYFDRMLRL